MNFGNIIFPDSDSFKKKIESIKSDAINSCFEQTIVFDSKEYEYRGIKFIIELTYRYNPNYKNINKFYFKTKIHSDSYSLVDLYNNYYFNDYRIIRPLIYNEKYFEANEENFNKIIVKTKENINYLYEVIIPNYIKLRNKFYKIHNIINEN